MVQDEEIRKAIAELSTDDLAIYLEDTMWEDIPEGSPEEKELFKIRDNVMDSFLKGYGNPEMVSGYHKLIELCKIDEIRDTVLSRNIDNLKYYFDHWVFCGAQNGLSQKEYNIIQKAISIFTPDSDVEEYKQGYNKLVALQMK